MAEHPVGAHRDDAASLPEQPVASTGTAERPPGGPPPAVQYPYPVPWRREPARVVIRADLLPAVSVLSMVSLVGIAVGWLWSRLAPPQRMVITADGQPTPLVAESYHRFDDLVLFALLSLGAGLVTGVAVWFLRERRGPVVMIAAVLGSAVGAWLAMQIGVSFAEGRYAVGEGVEVFDVVSLAPRLESGWAILAWPLATALAYGVLAAWNGMDDLGRRLG